MDQSLLDGRIDERRRREGGHQAIISSCPLTGGARWYDALLYPAVQALDGSAVLYPRLSPEAAGIFSSLSDLTWLLIVFLVASRRCVMHDSQLLCMSLEGLGREQAHCFHVSIWSYNISSINEVEKGFWFVVESFSIRWVGIKAYTFPM